MFAIRIPLAVLARRKRLAALQQQELDAANADQYYQIEEGASDDNVHHNIDDDEYAFSRQAHNDGEGQSDGAEQQ
jgi:hypothetical protein